MYTYVYTHFFLCTLILPVDGQVKTKHAAQCIPQHNIIVSALLELYCPISMYVLLIQNVNNPSINYLMIL
jgi:hypothetical protein